MQQTILSINESFTLRFIIPENEEKQISNLLISLGYGHAKEKVTKENSVCYSVNRLEVIILVYVKDVIDAAFIKKLINKL